MTGDYAADLATALRMLIGIVRMAELDQQGRADRGQISVDVALTGGGVEKWTITIERSPSSH